MRFPSLLRPFRERLAIRLIGGMLACVLAVWGFSAYIVVSSEERLLHAQADAHGASLSEAAAVFCIEPMIGGASEADYPAIETYAETLAKEKNEVVFIRIVRRDGRVVAEARAPGYSSASGPNPFGMYTSSIVAPDGEELGKVALGISSRRSNEIVSSRNRFLLLQSVTCFAVVAILLWILLKHWVHDRLVKLDRQARRLGTGDLQVPVAIEGSDELGRLARTMEHMRSNLHQVCQEIYAQNDALRQVNRIKREFLATMSHEIRTPLNGVVGMLDMLNGSELAPEHKELVETAHRSSQSLIGIVNELLDFSKIEAGKLDLERTPFSLRLVVADAMRLFADAAARKGIGWKLKPAPGISETLVGDPGRLRQILLNLLGNALKFTAQGGVELRIAQEARTPGEVIVRFELEDSGAGIPAELQGRLFQPFTQADATTTRKYGGTGLGLAITRRLVEMMGGEISVVSEAGRGSTFRFHVVLASDTTGRPPADPDPSLPPSAPLREDAPVRVSSIRAPGVTPEGPARILVVEDNHVNLRVAIGMLRQRGYAADCALNGAEAVESCRRRSYELVLMDLQMPEMDGYEAVRRLRAGEAGTGRHLPIVAFSANAMDEDRERCLREGFDGHLAKPVKGTALDAILDHWLTPSGSRAS